MGGPDRYVISLPSLLGVDISESSSFVTCNVTNSSGQSLMEVHAWRPKKLEAQSATEYVGITLPEADEEEALVALAPGICQLFRGSGEHFGNVTMVSETEFHLVGAGFGSGIVLKCVGLPKERRMRIVGADGDHLASVSFCTGSRNQATIEPQADAGLIVITLLAVDRFLTLMASGASS